MNRIPALIFCFALHAACAQEIISLNTNSLILTPGQQQNLRVLLTENVEARALYEPFVLDANRYLSDKPNPLRVINYEGMLDTDTARIRTEVSLSDIARIVAWYYASYGNTEVLYGTKVKEFVLAWVRSYVPTGNTINENKFVPLFWGYYLFKNEFSKVEQDLVEKWMTEIADMQMARPHTPNNNWQVKRIKIIGLVGGITEDQKMIDTALIWTKRYIDTSLFSDGTSNDLRTRDALHYHNSGLKALLTLCINLSIFEEGFHLYDYLTEGGGSIRKSVDYVVPYAMGEKTHAEWVNTQVELDRRRAAAGISKYQTGMLYDPQESLPLIELACYYDMDLYKVITHLLDRDIVNYTMTWESMLNSHLVRVK